MKLQVLSVKYTRRVGVYCVHHWLCHCSSARRIFFNWYRIPMCPTIKNWIFEYVLFTSLKTFSHEIVWNVHATTLIATEGKTNSSSPTNQTKKQKFIHLNFKRYTTFTAFFQSVKEKEIIWCSAVACVNARISRRLHEGWSLLFITGHRMYTKNKDIFISSVSYVHF